MAASPDGYSASNFAGSAYTVHEHAELTDTPRFFLTDAQHWESGRVIETWSYRWASKIFREFGKQVTELESAQVRKEEAVTRHFRLRCVAQSLLQRISTSPSASERCAFAQKISLHAGSAP